ASRGGVLLGPGGRVVHRCVPRPPGRGPRGRRNPRRGVFCGRAVPLSWVRCRVGRVPHRPPGSCTGVCSLFCPSACPGPGVDAVVGCCAAFAQFEGAEGVDHDGEFVEGLCADAAFVGAWLGAVGVAARMQGDRALTDPGSLAGRVVAAAVEHDLVGVDVGVVVGHRDRVGVVIDLAGHEVADDEVVTLEDLVDGGWLVDAAGDGLEVVDVEGVGVQAAVPSHDVEGVCGIGVAGAGDAAGAVSAVFDEYVDVFTLDEEGFGGTAQVAFAVGRVFEELAVAGQVALGWGDVAACLDDVGAYGCVAGGCPAVGGGARDDRVVAAADVEGAEDGFQAGGAGLDVDAFVADAVAVQLRGGAGHDVGDAYVVVAEDEAA